MDQVDMLVDPVEFYNKRKSKFIIRLYKLLLSTMSVMHADVAGSESERTRSSLPSA